MPTFNYECSKCHHSGEYLVPKHDATIYCPKCDEKGKKHPLTKKPTGFFIAGSSRETSETPWGGLAKKIWEHEATSEDGSVKVKSTLYQIPKIPGILNPGNN